MEQVIYLPDRWFLKVPFDLTRAHLDVLWDLCPPKWKQMVQIDCGFLANDVQTALVERFENDDVDLTASNLT